MRIFPLMILAALALFFASSVSAAEREAVSVKAELDSAFITIGDRVRYTVTLSRPADTEILSNLPLPDPDVFKIKKIDEFKRREKDRIIEGKIYHLTTYRLGEFVLGPIEVEYRSEDSPQPRKAQTAPLYLTVKSVTRGETPTDIRGLKSVLSLGGKGWVFWTAVFSLAGLLLAGIGIFFFSMRKKTFVAAPETPLTPEDQARLSLTQLFESDLLRRGKHKEYYLRLSDILRGYFEKRYRVPAVESTTWELGGILKDSGMVTALLGKILDVLESADLAKFAKWKPEPARVLLINKKALEIIDDCAPKVPPAGEPS